MTSRRPMGEKGMSTLILVGCVAIVVIVFIAYNVLHNAQNQERYWRQVEARRKIADRLTAFLQSKTMMEINLNVYHSPAQNPALRACVETGKPGTDCPNALELDFYQAVSTTVAEKMVGSSADPAYQDQNGDSCIPRSPTDASNCSFKTVSKCELVCPGGQTECGMVKIFQCNIEIAPTGNTVLNKLIYLKNTTRYASSYAVRLNRDKTAYTVVRE